MLFLSHGAWLHKFHLEERADDKKREYRPDIDGLRAFAVLAVLGFHAFPSIFKAGFLGVDVFFVISGYLISSIILKNLNNGTFSFLQFYSRRIRRIFPALLCVLFAVLAFGWFALFPHEYRVLGKHIAGGAFFASNFLLWKETGYFDASGHTKPLLHLWSLGIEEQFYIVFPALLYLCHKKCWRYLTILFFVGILSFLYNIYLIHIDQAATFYSPFTRVWELLAGGFMAAARQSTSAMKHFLSLDKYCCHLLYEKTVKSDGSLLRLVLAGMGVLLIFAAFLIMQNSTKWPGWGALFPVCGTACLIAAGSETWINRYLLGNRVAVFVGRISYPLYLWHWVLISYAWIITGDLATASTRVLRFKLVVVSFALAVATYLFVERPIRFGFLKKSATAIYLLLFYMCSIGGMGLTAYLSKGFPQRDGIAKYHPFETYQQSVTETTDDKPEAFTYAPNLPHTITTNIGWYIASFKNTGSSETIALYGDSTARAAYSGIANFNKQHNINTFFVGLYKNGAPIPDIYKDNEYNFQLNLIVDELVKKTDIKKIFIFHDTDVFLKENKVDKEYYITCMQNLINKFYNHDKIVYLVEQEPKLPYTPEYITGRPFRKAIEIDTKKMEKSHQERMHIYNKLKNVTLIHSFAFWTNGGKFRLTDSAGQCIYGDRYHLNSHGSKIQAEELLAPYLLSK